MLQVGMGTGMEFGDFVSGGYDVGHNEAHGPRE